ncbi:MAG: hypothetical protein ACLFPW_11050, partial [Spirochaetaceae bacterium]
MLIVLKEGERAPRRGARIRRRRDCSKSKRGSPRQELDLRQADEEAADLLAPRLRIEWSRRYRAPGST